MNFYQKPRNGNLSRVSRQVPIAWFCEWAKGDVFYGGYEGVADVSLLLSRSTYVSFHNLHNGRAPLDCAKGALVYLRCYIQNAHHKLKRALKSCVAMASAAFSEPLLRRMVKPKFESGKIIPRA